MKNAAEIKSPPIANRQKALLNKSDSFFGPAIQPKKFINDPVLKQNTFFGPAVSAIQRTNTPGDQEAKEQNIQRKVMIQENAVDTRHIQRQSHTRQHRHHTRPANQTQQNSGAGAPHESGQLQHQRIDITQSAENRLDINVDSWDAWVLPNIPIAINRRFRSREDLLNWMDWAQVVSGVVIDVLAAAEPAIKIAAIAVKGIVAGGRLITREALQTDINASRSNLVSQSNRQFMENRDAERARGRTFINDYLQSHPLVEGADEANNAVHEGIFNEVNSLFPHISASNLGQINQLVDQVFSQIDERVENERQVRARAAQVRRVGIILGLRGGQMYDRPGGLPTEEEAIRANNQARQETHYTGPNILLSEVYNGPG